MDNREWLKVDCPHCPAKVGLWCQWSNGSTRVVPHARRVKLICK